MRVAPPTRRSFWRFSIRELLLLMLAIAAFLGWGRMIYQAHKPFRPTTFLQTFDLDEDIAAVRKQIGESGPGFVGSSVSAENNGENYCLDFDCDVDVTAERGDAFMGGLRQRIRERIATHGLRIWGTGSGTSGSDRHFTFHYSRDIASGSVRAYFVRTDGEHGRLLVFFQEYRNWGRGGDE